jgi:DNA uptake protein ComE-like DNA-binding protein
MHQTLSSFRRGAPPRARACAGLPPAANRPGMVLVAVLVVVSLLALAAYQYSELMTSEYKAADSLARAAEARAAAASGVYYTAALLADKDSLAGTLGGNPYDNDGMFHGITLGDRTDGRVPAKFSVVAPLSPDEAAADASSFRYGVTDESGKINLNILLQLDPSGTVAHDILMKLPNMTEDVADAIIDWIDPDDEPRANGAESSYYSGMSPGYRCKNGPLDSLEELLLVRGVTPELLFGTDRNRNGAPDPDESDGSDGTPGDRGWSAYLTVYSRERNVDSDGNPRIYLNDKDTATLYTKLQDAFSGDTTLADFVMAYRMLGAYSGPMTSTGGASTTTTKSSSSSGSSSSGSSSGKSDSKGGSPVQIPVEVKVSPNPITSKDFNVSGKARQSIPSLFALVNAKVAVTKQGSIEMTQARTTTGGSPRGGGSTSTSTTMTVTPTRSTVYNSPLADPSKLAQLLPVLLDKCTTRKDAELPARINVNTAPAAVLATLPGLADTDVQMIQSRRPPPGDPSWSDPTFQTPAWLLTEAQLSPAKLQALERYVTATTAVYRVQSIGYFQTAGPIARIEAVIDTNDGKPRIVYWRDLSQLGKGFEIAK